MEHHWKKTLLATGDSNARRRSQSTDMLFALDHHASQKKGCIKPRVKQHCLFLSVQC